MQFIYCEAKIIPCFFLCCKCNQFTDFTCNFYDCRCSSGYLFLIYFLCLYRYSRFCFVSTDFKCNKRSFSKIYLIDRLSCLVSIISTVRQIKCYIQIICRCIAACKAVSSVAWRYKCHIFCTACICNDYRLAAAFFDRFHLINAQHCCTRLLRCKFYINCLSLFNQ